MAKDIHDRHKVPTDDRGAAKRPTPRQATAEAPKPQKSKFSFKGDTEAERQAVRDSFYKEDGVKADLTGGVAPESEN